MTETDLLTDPAATGGVRAEAEAALRRLVGRDGARLREDQWTAIEALVLGRRRALVVQRTGWGKSAVYFVATALLRARGLGPTIIVSPLLALMRNQIAAATRAGIHAVTVNSSNVGDWEAIYQRIDAGEVVVLLVSPERLNNPRFRAELLPRLAATSSHSWALAEFMVTARTPARAAAATWSRMRASSGDTIRVGPAPSARSRAVATK